MLAVTSVANTNGKFPIFCENPPLYFCSNVTIQVKLFCVYQTGRAARDNIDIPEHLRQKGRLEL